MRKSIGEKKKPCKNCEGKGTLKKGDKIVKCQRCGGRNQAVIIRPLQVSRRMPMRCSFRLCSFWRAERAAVPNSWLRCIERASA